MIPVEENKNKRIKNILKPWQDMKVYESKTRTYSRVFLCVWTHMWADASQKFAQPHTMPHENLSYRSTWERVIILHGQ